MNNDEIVENVIQLKNSIESTNYKIDVLDKKVDKLDVKIDCFLERNQSLDTRLIKLETKIDIMSKFLYLIGAASLGLILKEVFTKIWS